MEKDDIQQFGRRKWPNASASLPELEDNFQLVCDLKLANIILGIQSCSSLYSCQYCEGSKVDDSGKPTNGRGLGWHLLKNWGWEGLCIVQWIKYIIIILKIMFFAGWGWLLIKMLVVKKWDWITCKLAKRRYLRSRCRGTRSPSATSHQLQNPKWPQGATKMADLVFKG